MVSCPKCRKKISETSGICPYCNHWFYEGEIEKIRSREQRTIQIALGILLAVLVIIGFKFMNKSKPKENLQTLTTSTTEQTSKLRNQESKPIASEPKKSEANNVKNSDYVEVIVPKAEILFDTLSASGITVQSHKGNIFELAEITRNYYGIYMFTGEMRFIKKDDSRKIEYNPSLPKNLQLNKLVFREIIKAEDLAQKNADELINFKDVIKNIEYKRILTDKYKIEIFNKYKIQPGDYHIIILEGVKNDWK